MKKRQFLSIFVLLGIFLPICLQTSNAVVVDVWGVDSGDSKTYSIRDEINGSVSGNLEQYYVQYSILSISDTDSSNITDAVITIVDLSANPMTISQMTLLDNNTGTAASMTYWLVDFLADYSAIALYIAIVVLQWCVLLLPVGINWTAELNTINTSHVFPDYSNFVGYDQGNQAVITYQTANVADTTLQTTYNESGTIIWDKETGWLVSLEFIKTYSADFGFTIQTIIEPGSPSSIDALGIAKDTFAWLGLCLGIAGVCFTAYVYKKMK